MNPNITFGSFLNLEPLNVQNIKNTLPFHSIWGKTAYGRQSFFMILSMTLPKKVYLPYYICDSVPAVLDALNIQYESYSINQDFTPNLPELEQNSKVLIVNYFGLLSAVIHKHAENLGSQLIVDNTQAWFEQPPKNCWAFNSTRKFIGVPDGSCIWAPEGYHFCPPDVINMPDANYMISRFTHGNDIAYKKHKEAEGAAGLVPKLPSTLTEFILNSADYDNIKKVRVDNFRILMTFFKDFLPFSFFEIPEVPFMFPLYLPYALRHADFHKEGIFTPALWNRLLSENPEQFPVEMNIIRHLYPLPVDQRYSENDMMDMVRRIQKII
jgi:hypothetical protein